MIGLAIYANFDESAVDNSFFETLVGVAFLLACVLWILMWLEFARHRPVEYPYVWAFLLMTGPVLGPLLFYYRIWRARIKLMGGSRAMHSDASQVPGLSGMTVNERLFALGLIDEFDAAARRRKRDEMVVLLKRVELSDMDATSCTDAILADPARFGY